MVRLEGLEPPAHEVEARCSNPLSYSRIYLFIKTTVLSVFLSVELRADYYIEAHSDYVR